MNKYYPVIPVLLFICFGVQAQKKVHQKTAPPVDKGVLKTEPPSSPVLPVPSGQKDSKVYDSTLSKIQEQLHGRHLRKNKIELSLMAEPHRPIL